jgi:hypothetical protein
MHNKVQVIRKTCPYELSASEAGNPRNHERSNPNGVNPITLVNDYHVKPLVFTESFPPSNLPFKTKKKILERAFLQKTIPNPLEIHEVFYIIDHGNFKSV